MIFAAALGWPAFFVGHLLYERAAFVSAPRPEPVAALPVEACPPAPERTAEPAPVANTAKPEASAAVADVLLPPREAWASVGRSARAIAEALDRHDFATVAAYVSPALGLDVATQAYWMVDVPHLAAADLRGCAGDARARVWDEEPAVSCADYFKKVVRTRQLAASVHVTYNADVVPDALQSPELRNKYGHAVLVHYGGFGAEAADKPAPEVTLVFVPEGDAWRLAAIVGG
jgi:hypothetical protein